MRLSSVYFLSLFLLCYSVCNAQNLDTLESIYKISKNASDLANWENAILAQFNNNPDRSIKERFHLPLPPIVRGDHQLRFTIKYPPS